MLPTSARLLALLSLLHERRFWTGAELAQALQITTRSVRRDVDRLRALGYPVHATSGVGGGYALGAGKDLPPLPLDDEEAVAVVLGLQSAVTGPAEGARDPALRALSKVLQVLPQRLRGRVRALQSMSLHLPGADVPADGAVLAVLAEAGRSCLEVRFDYRDREGRITRRRAEPYRLVHASTRWYLMAWDLDRADWRTFRADRIVGEPRRSGAFRPRPLDDADVVGAVEHARSHAVWAHQARVEVHAPAEVVRARLPSRYAQVEALDAERCLVHTGGDDLDAMALYLALLGPELRVIEPDALREAFVRLAGRAARAGEGPAPVGGG